MGAATGRLAAGGAEDTEAPLQSIAHGDLHNRTGEQQQQQPGVQPSSQLFVQSNSSNGNSGSPQQQHELINIGRHPNAEVTEEGYSSSSSNSSSNSSTGTRHRTGRDDEEKQRLLKAEVLLSASGHNSNNNHENTLAETKVYTLDIPHAEQQNSLEKGTSAAVAAASSVASAIVNTVNRRPSPPGSPTRRTASNRQKRRSTYEKAQMHSTAEEHLLSARQRGCLFLVLFVLIIFIAMTRGIYVSIAVAMNRAYIDLPPNDDAQLPSLNLFDYDKDYSYPIFPEDFPIGLQRKIMPQMPDKEGKDADVWRNFLYTIEMNGGRVVKQLVDLRFTNPLQSELSGHIVFNVLFGDNGSRIREKVEADPHFFAERVILVRTPEALVGKMGERIPAGALFNLDGHHTNEVLKHCARIQHPSLRHGYIDNDEHICGKGFRTRQSVVVIEDMHPLTVIDLALEAGASSGQGLIAYDQ